MHPLLITNTYAIFFCIRTNIFITIIQYIISWKSIIFESLFFRMMFIWHKENSQFISEGELSVPISPTMNVRYILLFI